MRYAEYGPVSGTPPSMGTALTTRRTLDRLIEAVREQRYWVLRRKADTVSWTLRELDDTSGALDAPRYESGPIGADPTPAMDWASGLVEVESWIAFTDERTAFIDELHWIVTDIARRPRAGRTLVVRIEDDPHGSSLRLVVVRKRWTATDRLSAPLHIREFSAFGDTVSVLDWASARFGADRAKWVTVAEGPRIPTPVSTSPRRKAPARRRRTVVPRP